MTRGPSNDSPRTGRRWKGFALLTAALFGLLALGAARAGQAPTPSPNVKATDGRPMLAYWGRGAQSDPVRLVGSTVGQGVMIGLAQTDRVDEVSFFVDVPKSSTSFFAVDRRAPFSVPRRGRTAIHPYALGPHTLRADVLLVSGRHLRLSVAYGVAHILEMPESVDPGSLQKTIETTPPGPILVRPAIGKTTFTVSSDIEMKRRDVTIDGARIDGTIEFLPGSDGSALVDGSALGFGIFGADDILLRGNLFDGRGIRKDNPIWDRPAGSTPDRFRILGNTFENFYDDRGEDVHSQAIFVGYSTEGLIDGNTFVNNGSTSHIFVSYWGELADPARSVPRNLCIRRNKFGPVHGAYFAVNFRSEITPASGISVAPSNVSENVSLSSDKRYLRDC